MEVAVDYDNVTEIFCFLTLKTDLWVGAGGRNEPSLVCTYE
jgi:hypothetical protein